MGDLVEIYPEEQSANEEIEELLSEINRLYQTKNPLIETIKSPSLLNRALKELQNMIEMVSVKRSIVSQTRFLLVNEQRKLPKPESVVNLFTNSSGPNQSGPTPSGPTPSEPTPSVKSCSSDKFDGHMLHTVITGDPGTGKTTLARILAKIWMALGIIPGDGPKFSPDQEKINEFERQISYYKNKMVEFTISSKAAHIQSLALDSRVRAIEEVHNYRHGRLPKRQKMCELNDDLYTLNLDTMGLTNTLENLSYVPTYAPPPPPPQSTKEKVDPYVNSEPKFTTATRADLVAKYIGQTAPMTKKVLEKARGGVLFIDEAYSIVSEDSKRDFGHECLTVINEFMSNHPDELIIIFAGYKNQLEKTIFKSQPGLARRCTWTFNIEGYKPLGLLRILKKQLNQSGWNLHENISPQFIEILFNEHAELFHDSGGSTEKLTFYLKLAYSKVKFQAACQNSENIQDSTITKDMFSEAIKMICNNSISTKPSPPPPNMYL